MSDQLKDEQIKLLKSTIVELLPYARAKIEEIKPKLVGELYPAILDNILKNAVERSK